MGGSIVAGTENGGGVLINSGAIRAVLDIGSINVRGNIIGDTGTHVLICARGQGAPGATSDVAIKSLHVLGRVELTDILAGYDTSPLPVGVNADAQIGRVVVGDWIASNLVAGVQDNATAVRDDYFGNGDDQLIAGGSAAITSRIGSVVIKGTALGTVPGADSFAIVAESVGTLRIGGTVIPLTAGNGNDDLFVGVTGDLRVLEI